MYWLRFHSTPTPVETMLNDLCTLIQRRLVDDGLVFRTGQGEPENLLDSDSTGPDTIADRAGWYGQAEIGPWANSRPGCRPRVP